MKNTNGNRALDYYLEMNYPVTIYEAEEGGYVAEIEDLPGCLTQGETLEEVYNRIEEARRAWIEVAYEDGIEIPTPRTEQEYSGRFVTRVPRYLHRRLVEQAKREGTSLNQYVESILSEGVSISKGEIEELKTEIKQLQRQIENLPELVSGYEVMVPVSQWQMVREEEGPFEEVVKVKVAGKKELMAA